MRIIILLLCIITLTSCKPVSKTTSPVEYYPTYNSIDIKPGTMFNNILVSLEDYNSIRKEPSNKNELETATIYEYDQFEIETYYENNVEKIYSIRITSEDFKTNENISIGNTKQDMINTYGNSYEEIENIIFIYKLSNTNLSFTLENDIITEIVYYIS